MERERNKKQTKNQKGSEITTIERNTKKRNDKMTKTKTEAQRKEVMKTKGRKQKLSVNPKGKQDNNKNEKRVKGSTNLN